MAKRSFAEKAFAVVNVASLLAPHTCSRSTVTQKKNKRLLAVFMLIVCVLL